MIRCVAPDCVQHAVAPCCTDDTLRCAIHRAARRRTMLHWWYAALRQTACSTPSHHAALVIPCVAPDCVQHAVATCCTDDTLRCARLRAACRRNMLHWSHAALRQTACSTPSQHSALITRCVAPDCVQHAIATFSTDHTLLCARLRAALCIKWTPSQHGEYATRWYTAWCICNTVHPVPAWCICNTMHGVYATRCTLSLHGTYAARCTPSLHGAYAIRCTQDMSATHLFCTTHWQRTPH